MQVSQVEQKQGFGYATSGALPLQVDAGAQRSVDALCKAIGDHQEWLQGALLEHGALLFRGFDVDEPIDFERIALAVDPGLQHEYMGTSPRNALTKYVFTASELPGFYPIPQHCEMSFIAEPPRRVFFCCLEEPADGTGETPLVDFRAVYRDLDPEVRTRFEQRGVRIVRNYAAPGKKKPWELAQLKDWVDIFGSSDRTVVEEKCRREGFTPSWSPDNALRLVSEQPAVRNHPQSGEPVWFNHSQVFHISAAEGEYRRIAKMRPSLRHIALWLFSKAFIGMQRLQHGSEEHAMHCTYADGSEISQADMEAVRDAVWRNLIVTPWRKGDVVAIDNFSTAHGRLPYKGPREIAVAWA